MTRLDIQPTIPTTQNTFVHLGFDSDYDMYFLESKFTSKAEMYLYLHCLGIHKHATWIIEFIIQLHKQHTYNYTLHIPKEKNTESDNKFEKQLTNWQRSKGSIEALARENYSTGLTTSRNYREGNLNIQRLATRYFSKYQQCTLHMQ